MSVIVHDCEPDVTIECDGCEEDIYERGKVYCAKCADRKEFETLPCCICHRATARVEMFTKIIGLMCHRCAFLHEAKAAGLLAKDSSATP